MGLTEINTKCRPYYALAKKKDLMTDSVVRKFFDGTRSSLF